jgi:hypothetical protein
MGTETAPVLELYVRSLSADAGTSRLRDVLDRLDRLDASGAIESYDVTVWGDGVSLDERVQTVDAARSVRETVEALRAWADATDRDLPGFAVRETESAVTGEVRRNLTVPTLAVVERRDEAVSFVAPCHDDVTHTVDERLARLADGPDEPDRDRIVLEADD